MLQPCLDVIHSQLRIYSTGFFIGISFSVVLRVSIYMYQIQWYCPASYLYVWRFVFTICYSYQLQGKKISILNNWSYKSYQRLLFTVLFHVILICILQNMFFYEKHLNYMYQHIMLTILFRAERIPPPISIFLFYQTFSIFALEFISSISCVHGSIVAHIKSIKV